MTPLERFTRETLGCTCAPEVFRQVAEDRTALPGLDAPVRRLALGGRLLLYLIPVADPAAARERLGDWVALGRAERDRRGMNRVRLVLGEPAMAAAAGQALEIAAAGLPLPDERVHLHIIPAAALAAVPP